MNTESTFDKLEVGDLFYFAHDLDLFKHGKNIKGTDYLGTMRKVNAKEYIQLKDSIILDRRKNKSGFCPLGRGICVQWAKVIRL